jgi:hypothetical protein
MSVTLEKPRLRPGERPTAGSRGVPEGETKKERPLWQAVALLYAVLVVAAVLMITLAFGVAFLVTGRAY